MNQAGCLVYGTVAWLCSDAPLLPPPSLTPTLSPPYLLATSLSHQTPRGVKDDEVRQGHVSQGLYLNYCVWAFVHVKGFVTESKNVCVCVLLWRDRISSTDPWNPHFSFVVVFFVSLDMSNGLCSEILWKAQQKGKSKTKGGNYFGKIGIDLEKITIWFKTKSVLTKFSLWNGNHHQFLRKQIRTISKHKPDMKTLKCVLWKFCALHLMLKP